jgi:hypothetical protein
MKTANMTPARAFTVAVVILASSAAVHARPPAAQRSQPAVDLVTMKSGRMVRGVIVHADPNGSLVLAVARDWLRKSNPELLARHQRSEAETRKAALLQLRERITRALVGVAEDSRLGAFLRSESKRVDRLLNDANPPEEPRFLWLELTKKEVARIKPASPDTRRVAVWSWSEGLVNVETRDGHDLAHELQGRGVSPDRPLPDLSDQFPIRLQTDREWSARLALIVFALDKPLEFQGTGDQLIPIDRAANAPAAAQPLDKLLGAQLNSLFKDLLGNGRGPSGNSAADDWLKTARTEAERQSLRAFRATRVDLNLSGGQATVESVFAVRLDTGDWQILWSGRESQDAARQRPDAEAAITEDPQVKSALASLKSLGVGADDQIRHAVRFGAATMEAQKAADRRFFSFEEPLLKRLDGPPLWW